MNLQELLENLPVVHRLPSGEPNPAYIQRNVLEFLDKHLKKGARTLETGARLSTIVFAMKGCNHICVVPFAYEVDNIREYCGQNGISTESVRFIVERSEDALPRLDTEAGKLDLVLIDGSHGFPAPFIDWYYAAPMLRLGGLLIVDDTQLWTGHMLREFLRAEPEWEFVRNFSSKTAVFVKRGEGSRSKEWDQQPFVIRHSAGRARVVARRVALDELLRLVRFAARLLARGDFRALGRKLWKKQRGA